MKISIIQHRTELCGIDLLALSVVMAALQCYNKEYSGQWIDKAQLNTSC
jgi:hypothetical protein